MNMRRILVLSLLLGLVLTLGCTGGGEKKEEFSTTEGLRINKFGFDNPTLTDAIETAIDASGTRTYPNPDASLNSLYFEFENVGAKTIDRDKIKFYMYGPAMMHESFNADRAKWQIKPDTANAALVTFSNEGVFVRSFAAGKFFSQDTANEIKGSIESVQSNLLTPDIQEGMSSDYTFYGRLCYPYFTTTTSVVTKLSKEESQEDAFKEKTVQKTAAQSRNSAGPVQIELLSKENVRVRGTSLPLEFVITDVGGGFASSGACLENPNVPTADRGKVLFTVDVDGTKPAECNEKPVRLSDGRATVRCNYGGLNVKGTQELHITATATYFYYIDKEVKVTVNDDIDPKEDGIAE